MPVTFDGGGKIEACAVRIFAADDPLTIVSLYCPPPLTGMDVQDWIKFFNQFSPKTIFCGDFNAHHVEWGSRQCCRTGEKIKESIDNSDFLVLNKQVFTHYSSAHNTWDSIDIIISHVLLSLSIEWSISNDCWGSDHLPIFLEIGCSVMSYNPFPRSNRIQSKNINWKAFKERVNTAIDENKDSLNEIEDPEVKYSSFVAIITDALSPASKSKKAQFSSPGLSKNSFYQPRSFPPCDWWDAECDRFLRLRKAAWFKFKYSNLRIDFLNYKKVAAQARICFRNKKKEKFVEFCNNLRKDSNPSYIWKKVKAFKNRWNGGSNSYEFSGESLAAVENFIEEISPPSVSTTRSDFNYLEGDPFLDLPFSKNELLYAINSGKSNSAPGPDGIDYQAIRNLPNNTLDILLDLYNTFFKNKITPKEWNHYSMSIIPKIGNFKFRPISLASCVCKIMERMICSRLSWWLEHHRLLSDTQYGFRRNKSCIDNLAILHSDIVKSFIEKKLHVLFSLT